MKVTVIPKRPIPGILPKNKWIDREMELDLNKNEIKFCMQNAIVKDMNGNVIDELYVKKLSMQCIVIEKEVEQEPVTLSILTGEPIIIDMKAELPEVATSGYLDIIEPVVLEDVKEESAVEEVIEVEPSYPETPKEYFNLEEVSVKKEDEYIVLEVKMDTNSKLEGSLYGLCSIISGPRPIMEYKNGEDWIKFSNKFANFETIENDDRFVFRFIPKNENEFTYRVSIKTGNDVLAKLENIIKPSEL